MSEPAWCEDAETIELGSPFDHAANEGVMDERTPEPTTPGYLSRCAVLTNSCNAPMVGLVLAPIAAPCGV